MPREMTQKTKDKILACLEAKGAELLSIEPGRRVKYRCSCGNETESHSANITRATWKGTCVKCSNKRRGNMNNYEVVKKVWEDGGETLPPQEYKGNKVKMFYTCSFCGEEAHVSLSEFRRGRRCEHCAKTRASKTNLKKYGVKNPFQSEKIKAKICTTKMEKYGVDHHMKVPEILEKAKTTCMEKYGIPFAFHSEESFKKIRATCMEKYGVEFPLQAEEIKEKITESCRKKYGVDYPLQSKEIQEKIEQVFLNKYGMEKYTYLRQKIRDTMMEKYGVKNPMQVEKIFLKAQKSAHSYKTYTFPSGREEKCQGYEPRCFDLLLYQGYSEDDIEAGYKNRKAIWYPSDIEGEFRRYYPDGFIKSTNTVIEVKSLYTYEKDREKNERKFKTVVSMGMNLLLYVFDKKTLLYTKLYTPKSIVTTEYNYNLEEKMKTETEEESKESNISEESDNLDDLEETLSEIVKDAIKETLEEKSTKEYNDTTSDTSSETKSE